MISQIIGFESDGYENIKTFVSLLKKDVAKLGFENYGEFCKFIDKKVFFGCRASYYNKGSKASVEIWMFPKMKSGNIRISSSSCTAYDKAIKAIQAVTGLENLLQ